MMHTERHLDRVLVKTEFLSLIWFILVCNPAIADRIFIDRSSFLFTQYFRKLPPFLRYGFLVYKTEERWFDSFLHDQPYLCG
jgi:hypothetical protein